VDEQPLSLLHLDEHVKRRRGAALQHCLLRAAAARLLVRKGHTLDAADEVGQSRVEQQVF